MPVFCIVFNRSNQENDERFHQVLKIVYKEVKSKVLFTCCGWEETGVSCPGQDRQQHIKQNYNLRK